MEEKRNFLRFLWEEGFPKRLKEISDPPLVLYRIGKLPEPEKKMAAIVGARACSSYGKEMAEYFARGLAKEGIGIVSGMARGQMESRSGRRCQQADIRLRCWAAVWTSATRRRTDRCMKSCGTTDVSCRNIRRGRCRIRDCFRRATGSSVHFRISCSLSKRVKRGGTLITVDMALEQGKDVFAVPGRITDTCSRGCNRLIGNGAGIAVSVAQLLQELQGSVPHAGRDETFSLAQAERPNAANAAGVIADKMLCPVTDALSATASSSWPPLRKTIWQALDTMPQSMDEIADTLARQKISINVQMLMQELVFLELEGAAGSVMGRYYRKTFGLQ